MGYALQVTVEMTDMDCGECGIQFSVPETWRAEKKRNGGVWFCPNGHSRIYAESDAQKYKKSLAAEKERHLNTLARLNESKEAKKKVSRKLNRVEKRVNAGVCPCCNRTFKQLAAHMKNKHPDHKI